MGSQVNKLNWLENPGEIRELSSKRVVRVSDSMLSYYAEIGPRTTVEQAVEEFCDTYQFNETGTVEGLLEEIDTELWERFPTLGDGDEIPQWAE